MTRDIFDPLFELQDNRLDRLGNPLLELNEVIDWKAFRPILKRIRKKERKSTAGAKAKDEIMMFKGLVIQNLYGLSDDQLEYQIEDRRSFQRFLGLGNHQRAPDAKTFWAFRNDLSARGLVEPLFTQLTAQLNQAGYLARKGQIIDASIVPAPIQRNSRDENAKIKAGDVPEDWEENKRRQKDTEARWTKKNGKSYYGYKNHIEIDNANKLIRQYQVSDASVHDANVFEDLLDPDNSSADVWADSAYRSEEKEASLKANGYRSRVQRKGKRNKPLSLREQRGNRTRSKIRSRVEHVFGAQSNLREKAIRSIGKLRASTDIGLMNLVYNMRRFCFLERVVVS
jgi:IS5 family transposase